MTMDSHDRLSTEPRLPGEVVEEILSVDRRRTLLACLTDHGGEMAVVDLAACVGAREQGGTAEGITDATRDRLYDVLYDEHLPKLTATGIVEFDSLRDSVRIERADAAESRS